MIKPAGPFAQWESTFRAQMKALREHRGISQTDLAKQLAASGLAFHQQTIQRIENGDRAIRLDEAFLIAQTLGVELSTMTEDLPPERREIAQAVDRLTNATRLLAFEVGEALGEWVEDYEQLAFTLSELAQLVEDPSDDELWLAAWVMKATWVYDGLFEGQRLLNGIVSERGDWHDGSHRASDALEAMHSLLDGDRYKEAGSLERLELLADQDPQTLLRALRDGATDIDSRSNESEVDVALERINHLLAGESLAKPRKYLSSLVESVRGVGAPEADRLTAAVSKWAVALQIAEREQRFDAQRYSTSVEDVHRQITEEHIPLHRLAKQVEVLAADVDSWQDSVPDSR